MCTDTDTATDSGTETFILIRPCSDLCRTVRVNGWVCLSFWSLLVPFLAILSCPWKSPCDPAMPEISKITCDPAMPEISKITCDPAMPEISKITCDPAMPEISKIMCDPAMPEINKIKKDETEQLIALVRENVALYDPDSNDYSTASSLKLTSNSDCECTGDMVDSGNRVEGNA